MLNPVLTRRDLLKTAGAAVVATASPVRATTTRPEIPLGVDNFSVRAFGWKAPQLIDYSASIGADVLLMSDLDVYESHEDGYLADLRKRAGDLGLRLQAGSFSICPSSKHFTTKFGSAEEHLRLIIRIAKAIGSPVARCVLGSAEDRKREGGIAAHIKATVAVCKAARPFAMDSGVKIAIENHAGDMTAHELAGLIEEAGRDYVGATMDCGNATWALEDPLRNLEILGPYALTTGMRDSMVWETPEGAIVQWTAIGDGCVDFKTYVERFAALCPGVPFVLEIISGFQHPFPFRNAEFIAPYANAPKEEFERFAALAKKGRPIEARKRPVGQDKKLADQAYQKEQLERSMRYCRETLCLGLKR
ncbi:MAG TPA: sugar phosphate isomerase/epimerase [Verrucomicrobiae bacterium]|nr:sugar phosphate isomerase/epimerase [Verrucomicrobiae bacterium]